MDYTIVKRHMMVEYKGCQCYKDCDCYKDYPKEISSQILLVKHDGKVLEKEVSGNLTEGKIKNLAEGMIGKYEAQKNK